MKSGRSGYDCEAMKPLSSALLGAAVGGLYFWFGESHQEKESNCSYLAPASTDAMAMAAGLLLIHKAIDEESSMIGAIGGAIAGIHTGQYLHFKTGKNAPKKLQEKATEKDPVVLIPFESTSVPRCPVYWS